MPKNTDICPKERTNMQGVVIRATGLWCTVMSESDGRQYECRIRGNLRIRGIKSTNPVAVGDRVVFSVDAEGKDGMVNDVLPRKNFIVRRSVKLSKRTHILAANIDMAFIVATMDFPPTSTTFIDRFLATARAYRIDATVLFNKIDLYGPDQMARMEEMEAIYQNIGYPTLRISAQTGENIGRLRDRMQGLESMFSGHSGAGKSSIINAVEPGLDLKTAEISAVHRQGQHTTTFAQMFPLSFGGFVVDTPGIRGFGMVDMDPHEVGDYFPEIFARKGECRFNDCLHTDEPDCAVVRAVDEGRIAPSRYLSYLSIIEGDEGPYREDEYR